MSKNGIIKGQLHSECNEKTGCGVDLTIDNIKPIEAETDEAVITPNAFKDTKTYEVVGTPIQVASAINVMGGGKSIAKGAKMYDKKKNLIKTINHISPNNKIEDGDVIPSGSIIINRTNLTENNRKYKFKGNLKQIASEVNSLNQNGVVVEMGGESKMMYMEGGFATISGDRAGIIFVLENEVDNETRILIQKPSNARPKGKKTRIKFDFPKGHIEPNEKPFAAALREVKEEVGISLPKYLRKRAKANHFKYKLNKRGDIFNYYVLVIDSLEFENELSRYFDNYNVADKFIQIEEVESANFEIMDSSKMLIQDRLRPVYEGVKSTRKQLKDNSKLFITYADFMKSVRLAASNPTSLNKIKQTRYRQAVEAAISLMDSGSNDAELVLFYNVNVLNKFDNREVKDFKMLIKSNKSKKQKFETGGLAFTELLYSPVISSMSFHQAFGILSNEIKEVSDEAELLFINIESRIIELQAETGKSTLSSNNIDDSLSEAINKLYVEYVAGLPSKYMERYLNNVASNLTKSQRYYFTLNQEAMAVDENYTESMLPYGQELIKEIKIPKSKKIDRKSLLKIMSMFVGNDDLRPILGMVHKDVQEGYGRDSVVKADSKFQLVATNAHVLIVLRDKRYVDLVGNKVIDDFDIVNNKKQFNHKKTWFKDWEKEMPKEMKLEGSFDYPFDTAQSEITAKSNSDYQSQYPNYKAVMPDHSGYDYTHFEINVKELFVILTYLSNYGFLNQITMSTTFIVDNKDVDYKYIGYNTSLMLQALHAVLLLGETKIRVGINNSNNKRPIMITPIDNSDRFEMMVMPVMILADTSMEKYSYNLTTQEFITVNMEYLQDSGVVKKEFPLSSKKTSLITIK